MNVVYIADIHLKNMGRVRWMRTWIENFTKMEEISKK